MTGEHAIPTRAATRKSLVRSCVAALAVAAAHPVADVAILVAAWSVGSAVIKHLRHRVTR